MGKNYKSAIIAMIVLAFTGGLFYAEALTWKQENLVGLSNRFAVVVSDFESDGLLTHASLKSHVDAKLSELNISVVPENSPTPLGLVSVNVIKEPGESPGNYRYQLDLNVYNMETINTTYTLRKGTVWRMGSFTIIPGNDFPSDLEDKITLLLRYFARDYFEANKSKE